MSDAVLAVPFSRLFAGPAAPAGPSAAERQQAAVDAAFAAGEAAAEARLAPRIGALEAELDAQAARHAAQLEQAGRTAQAAMAALETALSEVVATLGLEVARHVLAREPGTGAETIGLLVADALAGLPEGSAGMVRMHPADAEAAPPLPTGWALVADPTLTPGELVAERGARLSAAGLALRLEQLAGRLEANP